MKIANKILSIAVSAIVLVVGMASNPFEAISSLMDLTLLKDDDVVETGEATVAFETVSSNYDDNFFNKRYCWINLNGVAAKAIGVRGMYQGDGILVTDTGYAVNVYDSTTTDYEYNETIMLKDYLDRKGIQLLYVNEPLKYLDDGEMLEQFGVESFGNQNADRYLERIGQAGIRYLDLRENIVEEDIDSWDLFYRTDHHWTVSTGLWATTKIVEELNAEYGYHIDTDLYDESNFTYTYFQNCWLGEQGRKLGASYIGLEDYTEIKPIYDTSFNWDWGEDTVSFDDLVYEDVYYADKNVYDSYPWYYTYSWPNILINNNVADGKILYLGDSYGQVVVPFLALGVHQVDSLVLRSYGGSLLDYIEAGDYDTVIIAYAEFMIGAHDNEASANYTMFSFE
jgi:hypothetical protein